MTNRLDDMIRDIHSDEAPEFGGKLEEQQQKHIEQMVLSAICHEKDTMALEKESLSAKETSPEKESLSAKETSPEKEKKSGKKKLNRRKWMTFLFAAAFIAAFAMTAGAAAQNDWDVAIVNFMGISDADTVQLPDGNIQIGVSDVSYGVDYSKNPAGEKKKITLTAASSIGDRNAAYIRFDTDYELPEDFDPERDYVLPEDMDLSVFLKNPQKSVESMRGSTFTCMEENGKLVLLLYIANCRKINKSYVDLTIKNLYLYHDYGITDGSRSEEPELLYSGSWSLDWKYSYRSRVKSKRMMESVELDGVKCFITHMEVSPLGIRFEGFVNPLNRVNSTVWMDVDSVKFKDGRILSVDGSSQAGCKDGIWLDGYCGIDRLGEALDVDEIESITIGGKEIFLK